MKKRGTTQMSIEEVLVRTAPTTFLFTTFPFSFVDFPLEIVEAKQGSLFPPDPLCN